MIIIKVRRDYIIWQNSNGQTFTVITQNNCSKTVNSINLICSKAYLNMYIRLYLKSTLLHISDGKIYILFVHLCAIVCNVNAFYISSHPFLNHSSKIFNMMVLNVMQCWFKFLMQTQHGFETIVHDRIFVGLLRSDTFLWNIYII